MTETERCREKRTNRKSFAFNIRWVWSLLFPLYSATTERIKLFLSFHWIWQFASIVTQCSQCVLIHENHWKLVEDWFFPFTIERVWMGWRKKFRTNLYFHHFMGLSNLLCLDKGLFSIAIFFLSSLYSTIKSFFCSRNGMKCTSESHLRLVLSNHFVSIIFWICSMNNVCTKGAQTANVTIIHISFRLPWRN